MIILLDENFPLRFFTRLQKEGLPAQHILLTDRGIHDKQIIARLKQEELLFLTQDEDFVEAPATVAFLMPKRGMGLTFNGMEPQFASILKKWITQSKTTARHA